MIDDPEDRRLRQLLQDARRSDVPIDLDRDLWPRMQERLSARPAALSTLDWAILAAVAGAAAAFPHVILGVLYNL